MAKRNFHVDGLSGVGKTTVAYELARRGYKVVETDIEWACFVDPATGLPGGPANYDNWIWDADKAMRELEKSEPDMLFVCGGGRNSDRFMAHFTKRFNLRLEEEVLRPRLEERIVNDITKLPAYTERTWTPMQPEEVEHTLALNRKGEKSAGAIDIDAAQPLDQLVDELLRLAGIDIDGVRFVQ